MDKEMPVSVWPEWKIIEKIGEGSFGRVYKAQRCEQGKTFYSAIKIITIPASQSELNSVRSETADESSAREYFHGLMEECIQEVSTMEHFRGNSHVVSVEDFKVVEYLDEIGWDIYIRMEFLTSFMDYCMEKSLSEMEVIQLGVDLCKALEHCKQLNIIHRDIKPENIFVSRFGEFKIGDFGIARELERTMSGLSKKGTYSYMAPEMYRGEQYDNRVDIYSLGIVLYKLMNHNRLPFVNLEKQLITYRDKENALARRMSGEALPKPADAGEGLSLIILKACAYKPEERYQDACEFRQDLEDLQRGILPQGVIDDLMNAGREAASGKPPAAQSTQRTPAENWAAKAWGLPPHTPGQSGQNSGEQKLNGEAKPAQITQAVSQNVTAASQNVNAASRNVNAASRNAKTAYQNAMAAPQNTKAGFQDNKAVPQSSHMQKVKVQPPKGTAQNSSTSTQQRITIPQRGTSPSRRRKKKSVSPWTIAVIVVAIAACIITAVYIKLLLDEDAQTQESGMVQMMDDQDYSSGGAVTDEFNKALQEIKNHATTITDNLGKYSWQGMEGDIIYYTDPNNNQLMKALVYPAQSEDNVFEEYYYWDEEVFFAYIWETGKEPDYYYFDDGELIRWIDDKKVCHDNETDNSEYVKRGEKYLNNAETQLTISKAGQGTDLYSETSNVNPVDNVGSADDAGSADAAGPVDAVGSADDAGSTDAAGPGYETALESEAALKAKIKTEEVEHVLSD